LIVPRAPRQRALRSPSSLSPSDRSNYYYAALRVGGREEPRHGTDLPARRLQAGLPVVTGPPAGIRSWPVEVTAEGHVLRGWVCTPNPLDHPAPRIGLYCLAGGGLTVDYFDLQVAGSDGYSMARYLAERGVLVVALDHPGVGSSPSVPDTYALTPTIVASAHDSASRQVAAGLRHGRLVPGLPSYPDLLWVGLGHSMGGMLLDVVQGAHRRFSGLVGLGHSGAGLPDFLTAEERDLIGGPLHRIEPRLVELARARFGSRPPSNVEPPEFFDGSVPMEVRRALAATRTELLYTCGLAAIITGSTDHDKAAITVPLFLALGDHDLVTSLAGCIDRYPSVGDATLFMLAGSGHCHSVAGSRALLWDRILRWLQSCFPDEPESTLRVPEATSVPALDPAR
jgi:alpha-beta hydrolase superfamily lysophospholipase